MDALDLAWFHRNVGTQRCFPALLQMEKRVCPVWIGYRGRYSRRFRKPSYDIWFGEERPLDGAAQIHLNAAYRDPSLLRSCLSLDLFAAMGVLAPGSWHVSLEINQQPCGVYTAVESLDATWLLRHGIPSGSIYYAVGSRGNFGLIDPVTGRPKRELACGYEKCFPWDDDFTDLEALICQIAFPEADAFESGIAGVVDVENCLRWLIGLEFMSHTDGLVQNYALFRPDQGRWQLSPWDCDGTWGRFPNGQPAPADRMDVGTGEDNYLLARLLRSRRWQQRYLEIWHEVLPGVLSSDYVEAKLDMLFREIRRAVLQDQYKRRTNTTFLRECGRIRRYLQERRAYVQRRLFKTGEGGRTGAG